MMETRRELRLAARALARHGLAHAYGHVSRRLDDERFMVCPSRPMGLIAAGDPGTVVPVRGALP
ncbi:MAG: class II aldolase/adducin family protein, partial [Rhizobiales bacterium]|nr:class II aldolase/adducin family protein [Rhizobacter sp.]